MTVTSHTCYNVRISKGEMVLMKPTIMILGCTHLANPGIDAFNVKMDDVLSPKRQSEIEQLVTQLKGFRPTKISLELDEKHDIEIQENYQGYLNGTYELERWEIDQIGFRLAKLMGHPKLYCVDYWPEKDPILSEAFGSDLIDFRKFAKEHNQEHFLPTVEDMVDDDVKTHQEKDGRTWIESEKYLTLIDMFIQNNIPEGKLADHQIYLRTARIGEGTEYPGAIYVGNYWYARNLKIFVNLTRITESADDRILLIIGAGHVYLIQQFLEDSGDYIVESPLKYLKSRNP